MLKFKFLFFILCFIYLSSNAQKNKNLLNLKQLNFGSDIGCQMSGIKKEDFIKSNYSPLISFYIGKSLNKNLTLDIVYRGRYFNTIADNKKHFYDFYFLRATYDSEIFLPILNNTKRHELLFDLGFGYFINHFYNKSSTKATLGISNNILITPFIFLKFHFSAIFGYDIYQGDKDILPSLSLGLNYKFRSKH